VQIDPKKQVMKLRIKGNSVRMRLTQSEAAQLRETGVVSETVDFAGGGQFVYAIDTSADDDMIKITFENCFLRITVPGQLADEWVMSEQVGLESNATVPAVLIEKDFACLTDRPNEDESDMFPHPGKAACG
jgi:hypothetical protein